MKTGTVDGQENPLSILNAAKFYEVSEQILLTSHMCSRYFSPSPGRYGTSWTPIRKKLLATHVSRPRRPAAKRGLPTKRRSHGTGGARLAVDAVDLGPFRASADKVYADSDLAKAWDAAGLQCVQKA